MAKTTDIRNAIASLVTTTLPDYVQLPDSIDSIDNSVINLEKGFSVGVGSGANETSNFCPGNILVNRSFNIALTNTYVSNLDPYYRVVIENNLLDDLEALSNEIDSNVTLGGLSIDCKYIDDTGLEYLESDQKQFILTVMTISVKYIT